MPQRKRKQKLPRKRAKRAPPKPPVSPSRGPHGERHAPPASPAPAAPSPPTQTPSSPSFGPRLLPAEYTAATAALPGCPVISEEMLAEDVAAGFALEPDGTLDVVKYGAWLLRRHGYGEGNGHA